MTCSPSTTSLRYVHAENESLYRFAISVLGQLALPKATSPEVKQFAQRMVSDHTEANQELMLLAKSEGRDLPSQVDAKHTSATERLQGMNGSAFDTAYMQSMVQDHEQDVADFQKEAQSGSDQG